MAWRIESDYFENCNCEVLCPCITSHDQHGDYERCYVPLICHIVDGHYEDVRLDDLSFVILADTPGIMSLGNWSVAYYLDERADERQRQALEAIVTGRAGGVPERLATLVGTHLGVKYVPIEFAGGGERWSVRIPDILDVEIEGVHLRRQAEVVCIDNVNHSMGSRLAVAKALRGRFSDHGLAWDNTGKNGHYARFVWEG